MVSSARIDGSMPDPGDNSTSGLIFSGAWGVQYEFAGSPLIRDRQPVRLRDLGFPAPYDQDLEGALRGRGAFSDFLYLFKDGKYLRLRASSMTPDGPDAEQSTAAAWGLPAIWTRLDAVLPGRGSKINFCYFLRGPEYIRFDWLANQVSPGYPKSLGQEWHLGEPFNANIDGFIAGQSTLGTKGYVFTQTQQRINDAGAVVPAGTPQSRQVRTLGFVRYDFNSGLSEGAVTAPLEVSTRWGGLMALLDAGPAIDIAIHWCDRALGALSSGTSTSLTAAALAHHFRTGSPSAFQLANIRGRLTEIRTRLRSLPTAFRWTRGLPGPAQTSPGTFTEIGDEFSTLFGPNGRAAVLIHEAVHFVATGSPTVDVPEWSGETINGVPFGISPPVPGVDISGIAYSALTPDQAIANPSSYAAFAQEIAFGADTRFGIGRPQE